MAHEISVGSLATAKRDSGICEAGEVGVCYEVYQLGNRSGYSFIFERGGYDGFSPDDVNTFLEVSGRVSSDAASYQFSNVGQLNADYRAGRFDKAFGVGRMVREAEDSAAWPQARDVLKREWDEAANRPRDIALEKHGATIETKILEQLWPRARDESTPEPQEPDRDMDR